MTAAAVNKLADGRGAEGGEGNDNDELTGPGDGAWGE